MVAKSVVTNGFYERVMVALQSLQQQPNVGTLKLAMLVPNQGTRDSWSLVIASEALDQVGLLQATSIVVEALRKALGKEASQIDAVTILRTSQPTVRTLGEAFDIPNLGTAYRGYGVDELALNLEEPVMFVAKAA
jgi:hypothetical protein